MGTSGAKEKKEGKTSPKDDKKPRNEILKEENKKDEANTGHKGVPIKISIKVMKSICKITIKYKSKEKKNKTGTGFFMKIFDSLNYLITNYHVINPKETDEIIEIEIHNQKNMTLNLENRNIIYIEKPKDITAIEIKETDEIYDDIEFLNYDMNYKHNGYSMYKGADILTVGHPNGDDAACASGTIIEIYDYEFDHNISTEDGSSGSPIILLNNNINLIQVIGIHKNADNITKLNGGTFIGELFKEINFNSEKNDKTNESQIKLKKEKSLNKNNENNYIIAGIYINDKNINKDIRIINSYEEWMRKNYPKDPEDTDNKNSKIKDDIFNLDSIQEENQDKSSIKKNEMETPYNEEQNITNKNINYLSYTEKMLEIINNIRKDPVSYADIIEDSMQNIIEEPDKNDESKTKKIYKYKIKVALNRGEAAFEEAAEELRNMESLPPLILKNDICVPLPDDEEDIKNSYYLREQVKLLREKSNIDVFFKDLIKIPEVSALLMVVDDSERNPGKKREAVLSREFKYIGISSKFIGKTFIAYFAFSK